MKLIPESKVRFTEKYSSVVENIKSYQLTKVSGKFDTSISTDISIFHNDFNFQAHVQKIKDEEYNSDSTYLIAKYNLGSLSINNDDISMSDEMKKKINYISEDITLNDIDKAKELDKIFRSYGFFIPLTINIGGQFIVDSKEIEKTTNENFLNELITKIDATIKYNNIPIDGVIDSNISYSIQNIMKEMYVFKKTSIVGGNIYKNNFDDWLSTLTLENCDITGYGNIIPVTDLLDYELKRKLSVPLKQIEKKYMNRKKYIEIFQDLQKKVRNEVWQKEREGNDGDGIVEENDLIYVKKFKVEKGWSYFYADQDFSEIFPDMIVGWKTVSSKEHNGKWTIEENPLLQNSLKIHFSSGWLRGINYEIYIYLLDYPD